MTHQAAGPGNAPDDPLEARPWVCLDIGEVLIDETRVWTTWAQVLGVTPLTLHACLGAAIASGGDHREAFDLLGFQRWADHSERFEQVYGGFRASDLYPDALPGLDALRNAGYRVALAGNQPQRREAELARVGVSAEVLVSSDSLGAEKPSAAFFAGLLRLLGDPAPGSVFYVGDRVDNDVEAAAACGLRPVWLRRGPWGALQSDTAGRAELVVSSLTELAARLEGLARG